MPGKNEKERRRKINQELRRKAREEFENSLPISREQFKALFDYLGEHRADYKCDNSLKHSIAFLQSINSDKTKIIIDWLIENGGSCDCEVLANVEEKFENDAIL